MNDKYNIIRTLIWLIESFGYTYVYIATKNTGFVSGSDEFYLHSEYVFAT